MNIENKCPLFSLSERAPKISVLATWWDKGRAAMDEKLEEKLLLGKMFTAASKVESKPGPEFGKVSL